MQKNLAIDSVVLMVSSATNAVVGLAFWVTATRLNNAEIVGEASTSIAVATTLSTLGMLGFAQLMERFLPRASTRQVLGAIAFVAAFSLFLGWLFDLPWLTLVLALFALCDSYLIGCGRPRVVALKNLIHAMSKFALVFVLPIDWAWGIPTAALLIFYCFGTLPKRKLYTSDVSRYFMHSVGWLLAQMLPGLVIPLMVKETGLDQAAYFNIAWVIVNTSFVLISMIGGPFVAKVANAKANMSDATRTLIRIIAGVSALRLLGVSGLGPIALFVYGSDYAEHGYKLLILMGVAHLLGGPAYLYATLSRIFGHIGYPMLIQALNSLAVVGLIWLMLPAWGITSVGIAYLIVDAATLAVIIWPLKQALHRALTTPHNSL
ncbi:lipopolysaccharide biosynthesis protein [Corynebacterium sp.]|uniref:lipopolysaccharide biosynthesis protein n=1 Tax=Corynebacterium sp. TaxID=1720 RepID=UPI0026DD4C1B|nr:hypothetical protein [Corynebacterium sp.]MDO5076781.1 hypothetical protein [Corynebacterium sp.]